MHEITEKPVMPSTLSRYLVWGSAELFFIVGVVVAIFFAILSPDVAKELNLSESQLGTLSGTFFLSYSVGQLVLGSLLGTYSPRLLLAGTAFLSAAGCFLFAVSTSMPVALVARALLGLGLSLSFVGVMHVVSRDFSERFSFMAALSQSLTNVIGGVVALVASFTAVFATFREPFMAVGVAFVPVGLALLIFIGTGSSTGPSQEREKETASIGTVLATCFGSLQFWMGLVYYSCLFGTVLAYSDLWNIQFQTHYFAYTTQQGSLLNAAIALGVTAGSLLAGAWAQARGDHVLPARAFGLLGVVVFAVLFVLALDETLAIVANFMIGVALAGSILGFTALQKNLPEFARATATAIVATAAFVMGGAIQPLIGLMVDAPVRTSAVFSHLLLSNPEIAPDILRNANFGTYQRGLMLLLATVTIGFLASLLFRPAKTAPPPV